MTWTPWLELLWPLLVAVFVWWFSTGIVLMLDGLPARTFGRSRAASTVVGLAALVCLSRTASHDTLPGTYAAFLCALLVWAWIELAFLTGWVTGPNKQPAKPGARGWSRFVQALQTVLWHELMILALTLIVLWLTWGQPNPVGGWTMLVLWVMRTSAKLNLFLGVRNRSEEFLPPQLAYLASHFRARRMNGLLPVVVLVGGLVALWLVQAALAHGVPPPRATALILMAALLGLALLEHGFMVLPVSANWLWRWALRHPPPAPAVNSLGTP